MYTKIALLLTLLLSTSVIVAIAAPASPPKFVEPSKLRLTNISGQTATYDLTIVDGSPTTDCAMQAGGTLAVVYTTQGTIDNQGSKEFNVATIPSIPQPFKGSVKINSNVQLQVEFYTVRNSLGLTVHNLTDCTGLIYKIRYYGPGAVLLKSCDLPLAPDEYKVVNPSDCTAPPGGAAYVEVAGANAFEAYYTMHVPGVHK